MIFYTHECEDALGYSFKNQELLRRCFTHSSYSHEHKNCQSNERLEFLGDSVLGFVVANYLYEKKADDNEGKMTTEKQNLVSTKPLADAARRLKLDKFLLISDSHTSNITDKICENLFESVVAGLYLDGGLEVAEKFIKSNLLFLNSSKKAISEAETDPKSKLQMLLQKKYKNDFKLEYAELKREGPPHKPTFTMAVVINGEIVSKGKGYSKTVAEQEAASIALKTLDDKKDKDKKSKDKIGKDFAKVGKSSDGDKNAENVAFTANGGGKNDNNFAKNDKKDKDLNKKKGKNFTAEDNEKGDKNFVKEINKQHKKKAKEETKSAKKSNENFAREDKNGNSGKGGNNSKNHGSFFENKNGKTDKRAQGKSKFFHGKFFGDKGAKEARYGNKNKSNKEGK